METSYPEVLAENTFEHRHWPRPTTPWHGRGHCASQCRGAGQGGSRGRGLRAGILTACCILLSGSSTCIPSEHLGDREIQFMHPSVSPRGSEALLSGTKLNTLPHPPWGPPRRDSVSRLETTLSRISLRTSGPAANQTWDQPQSISECPGCKAPTQPPRHWRQRLPREPKATSNHYLVFCHQTNWTVDYRLFPR